MIEFYLTKEDAPAADTAFIAFSDLGALVKYVREVGKVTIVARRNGDCPTLIVAKKNSDLPTPVVAEG